jgi:hypothetical protein
MNLEENSIVSNKPQDDDSLELSDSTVMAERASITADNTSTSAFGDEPSTPIRRKAGRRLPWAQRTGS